MAGVKSEILTPRPNGFTLVEIVITIVLVGILAGIAAMIILQGVRAYSDEQSRSDVHYQARYAMERMAREIRQIRSTADITAITNSNLQFTDVNGAGVGFTWTSPTLSRWNGAGTNVLAPNITAFNFNYYQQNGVAATAATLWIVEITLTSQQGSESVQMSTRVHSRNF
jgi:prepilin-type N-terminal cleavage/methylation domain-containing protein